MRLIMASMLAVVIAIAGPAAAQLGPYDWGGVLDESCWDSGASMIAEIPGAGFVLAGQFAYASLTLGDETFTPAASTGNTFVTCMDGADSHVWSRHLVGVWIYDIATRPDGSTVLVGRVADDYDLGEGPVTGSEDHLVLLSLDEAGQTDWSVVIGGSNSSARALAVDDQGEIFVAGSVDASVDLGGGLLPYGGGTDAFVAKFDAAGGHLWSLTIGDGEFQSILDLDVDPTGNVVVSGWGTGTIDIGLGPVSTSSLLNDSVLLASLDGSGGPRFARWIESPYAVGRSVACGPAGEIFVTGQYNHRIYFDDGTLFPVDADDIFVAKFTNSGAYVWARSYGTETNEEKGRCVRSDGSGGAIVTGMFRGSLYPIDFGGGPVSAGTSHNSAFILFLDGDGNHRASYGRSYGPTSANSLVRGVDGSIAWVGTSRTLDEQFHAFITKHGPLVATAAPMVVPTPRVTLLAARPNPFNPRTRIGFVVDAGQAEQVRLRVYDTAGRLVKTLFDDVVDAGSYGVEWDGTDLTGRPVSSGTYFCRLDSESGAQTTKLSLVR